MSTYAIGDIQGCYESLQCLLEKISFNPQQDRLWLVGDLINRGPDSLATLRFLYSLRDSIEFVLGNHDLHFLAVAQGLRKQSQSDTVTTLLNAPDKQQLVNWLRQGKLLHTDTQLGFTMVHAGIPPQWTLQQAAAHAREVESALQSRYSQELLSQMYGNSPNRWKNKLIGMERLRLITNYFTRMRFCTLEGDLELETKDNVFAAPVGYAPWFTHAERKTRDNQIVFGHWAALEGRALSNNVPTPNVYALDTGCVWGGALTAMRLDDKQFFSCSCASHV
jgi:bis(5'-nucleosyl)-tetraphosphatase (symmetrical)